MARPDGRRQSEVLDLRDEEEARGFATEFISPSQDGERAGAALMAKQFDVIFNTRGLTVISE
jgi:hypothetical protein